MNIQFDMTPHVVCDARLETEELEAVIAPGLKFNHNEHHMFDHYYYQFHDYYYYQFHAHSYHLFFIE